ncbi:MAG TPA: hypothetical protein VHD62_09930 [Opitutaceae bacterium]|nr:hypothetical protein [Opitutaceae bacterium]
MRLISLDLLTIILDIPLVPPQTKRTAGLDAFGAWLCEPENGLGMRPEQVRVKSSDDLFGWELTAQFFGENGLITRTPDRVKLSVKNVRTVGDWELVRRIIVRFYMHMNLPPYSLTTFSAHVHSRFPAADELESFFREFPQPAMASRPVLFTYVKIDDWEADIRLLIEKSNLLPDAIFVAWDTQFGNSQDWESFVGTLPTVMENSVHLFDLGLTRTP